MKAKRLGQILLAVVTALVGSSSFAKEGDSRTFEVTGFICRNPWVVIDYAGAHENADASAAALCNERGATRVTEYEDRSFDHRHTPCSRATVKFTSVAQYVCN